MTVKWEVYLSNNAKKSHEKLKRNGQRPSIASVLNLLLLELEMKGPERVNWPNYGKLSKDNYHCHLRKGRPTFVACWKILSEKSRQIEVFYVGTHEGAPY